MIIVTTPLITMKRLLMAYDGSEASEKALEMTLKCAAKEDEIIILTVIPGELVDSSFTNMLLPTIDLSSIIQSGSFKEKAMQNLQKVANRIESHVAKTEVVVESGDAADEILLASKKYEIDIIIVGYKGYGKEGRFLLGSVADKVVRHASRSVLVVR
ncbi:MAG: universal stress protein [Candidatus Thermoplasmatota archaeon]|nr:universal stress protein [Candidatus Thermoplasmatota archaeon]